MSDPKPFASLSSGLLARKGTAKPAMRPQGYGSFGSGLEDLGWNDMGGVDEPPHEHVPSSIAALTPAPGGRAPDEPAIDGEQDFEAAPAETGSPESEPSTTGSIEIGPGAQDHDPALDTPEPPVIVEQQRVLAESFSPPVAIAPVVQLPRREAPRAPAHDSMPARAKAAFTLRLDPDRHLKLRLACAIAGRSAQQLVTGALDSYLASLPDVDALAQQIPANAERKARG